MNEYAIDTKITVMADTQEDAEDIVRDILSGEPVIVEYEIESEKIVVSN